MRQTLPVRRVCRHEVRCSSCGTTIRVGECVSTLFNYNACKNRSCETSITERYAQAKVSARAHRVYR
ncbi:hypothetical protein HWB39_gp33 [Streptomyces phage WRightOn]|jgi:hypothetical protein|uniref:Uncharacterized protein n=4 Tax=Caudoviricetes TaxID=2731619 RepID=A0A2H4PI61_9CAUD|nr:hypothetical protein HWB39_gp33 [Streptomyces phage WRightOn]YP_009856795.1 hypothetical protein HWD10_gp35 [Streptomyces phage JXY1]QNN98987.1 hypothetical protein SEA_ZEIGLE_66 [Streptomyces phage Zeigle]WNA15473.1 hypothetical protein SEA_KUMQUAT_66 [Streptomyces phage Kumquat]ATW62503.1 hypothetical protein SEA_WRIGHTON_70 [Streptomyces phage WRightOn]QIA28842.1 hypothetical protein [Streptomyces phage JXY1]